MKDWRENSLELILPTLFCQYSAWDIIGLTLGQKKWQYLAGVEFFLFCFLYCSFVHRLTSDPVFRVEGTGGVSATAASIFCHPGQRVLHLGRQERKTEEGHVEWEKNKQKNIRPGRGIIIFPLISSVWRSSHLRENTVYDTIYCHMSREKHHHFVTFHYIGQDLSTLSEPGASLIPGINIDNIKSAY